MDTKFQYKETGEIDITLRELLLRGIEEHVKEMEEISENATKEYALETALNKMEKEWENLSFTILNWKNRNIKIL
jgi:dynein heavy chain